MWKTFHFEANHKPEWRKPFRFYPWSNQTSFTQTVRIGRFKFQIFKLINQIDQHINQRWTAVISFEFDRYPELEKPVSRYTKFNGQTAHTNVWTACFHFLWNIHCQTRATIFFRKFYTTVFNSSKLMKSNDKYFTEIPRFVANIESNMAVTPTIIKANTRIKSKCCSVKYAAC